MTRDERLALIEELDASIAEGLERIARSEAEREASPAEMQDWLMAEPTPTVEVHKDYSDTDLIYKTTYQPAPIFTEDQMNALGEAIALERAHQRAEREKAIAPLKNEIATLRAKIDVLMDLVRKRIIT